MTVVEWLNNNNGFTISILTLVYVIATIAICIFNYKSAKATREQTMESKRQYEDLNKAFVIPKITELEGKILCLSFQNIGRDIAKNVEISINNSWLKLIEKTATFPETAIKLKNLSLNKIYLTSDQIISYGLCIPGNGHDDMKILQQKKVEIKITYESLGKKCIDNFEIDLKGYNSLVNTSDYVRMMTKLINSNKEIKKEFDKINRKLSNKKDK
ncbi:MAG: hypothetical protein MR296_03960 [Tenericutes bacterium]|nr:hypothetical protein [Mycoplasmatota bacterium]